LLHAYHITRLQQETYFYLHTLASCKIFISKTKRGTDAGLYCHETRRKLSFSLGQYTTIFQAEVYAVKACAVENLDRQLVWDRHQSLIQLARHNRVQLIWVPGHEDIAGNETADLLARTGSEHPFTGPEPSCGISIGVAKTAVRDWTNRKHMKQWESTTGLKEAKGLISGPSARRTKDLLKLNKDQLRWIVGLFTGHCHLRGHLFKLRLTDDPTCERCLEEDELATRVVSFSQVFYLNKGQYKHRINISIHTKHPCSNWDSNPRSQRPSERASTAHALDRSATVADSVHLYAYKESNRHQPTHFAS
jgi:hypothetical protein